MSRVVVSGRFVLFAGLLLGSGCASGFDRSLLPDGGSICDDVVECVHGDDCCPSACSVANDIDCVALCGNGVVEAPETCDGDCPAGCDDSNACTLDFVSGVASQCNVACFHAPVTNCDGGDGCCATGCDATSDADCSATCGNDVVESGETCDGNCPTTCPDDGSACTNDVLTGASAQCSAACAHLTIATCTSGDGCCAAGCTSLNDADCSATCGNGTTEGVETCDGNCPATCDDGVACTTNVRTGNASQCNVECAFPAILACAGGDGCCASGCNANNDADCTPSCGNGVVESGELCDAACPATCSDGNACTTDTLSGAAGTCDASCSFAAITACAGGDGCCPSGCTGANDADCVPPFCTLEYALTGQYKLSGGDDPDVTATVPEGRLVLRMQTNASGGPLVGGGAELLFFWIDVDVERSIFDFDLNLFSATCNGTTSPPTSPTPDPCAYTDTSTTGAVGTFTGTQVTWGACTRHGNYGGTGYTTSNASVSSGVGCMKSARSVGVIRCDDSDSDDECDDYGFGSTSTENLTFHQPLEAFTFTNGVQNVQMPFINVPDSRSIRTQASFTGVRSGGTCP